MKQAPLHRRYLWRRLRRLLARAKRRGHGFVAAAHVADGQAKGRALLVHLVEPFLDRRADVRHQNRFQASELGRVLAARGYAVDVLAPAATIPAHLAPYDVVIDLHPGLSRYPTTPETRTIAYITGSNPAFANQAERDRLDALKQRRGIAIAPRRAVPGFSAADLGRCDAMFFIGSPSNLETYASLPIPPVHFVRNFAYLTPPIARARAQTDSFLFLASGGQVHKGLDLLLEVFARRPEWTLHVCSSFHEEPDFCRVYRHELFDRPNVVPHGFMALDSNAFAEVASRAGYVVLPSCSEADAGSVLSGMAAGLVPVVSRPCGFDEVDLTRFEDCSLATIEATLARCATVSATELDARSMDVRRIVAERYTPDAFTRSLEAAMDAVL